ncbi:proton-coupled amino acid transporter-like protein pathetic [Vespa velutina]|uniref:proton-coupled amino acid transporter-like protein pathetic n=1 Tax=Vespa velutina TaxID=202808 RepID=UPI001FB3E6F9|nr:proton-coupled amino acid transporter-like protein pathetic [Vespa velutina]
MPFSMLGTIIFIIGMIICMIYFIEDFPSPKRLDPFTNIQSITIFINIFFYTLHNVTILLPLENTMHKPNNLTRLIIISTIFNTLIYIVFAFLGYNKYKDTCDIVIKNLPLDEVLSEFVKIGIAVSVLFTIPINYIIPVTIIWPVLMNVTGIDGRYEIIFRIAGITITTIIAIAIPQILPLTGLLSALGMTSTILLIPILVEINTKWQEATYILYIKNGFIFILFLMILIFGTIENLRMIIIGYTDINQIDC